MDPRSACSFDQSRATTAKRRAFLNGNSPCRARSSFVNLSTCISAEQIEGVALKHSDSAAGKTAEPPPTAGCGKGLVEVAVGFCCPPLSPAGSCLPLPAPIRERTLSHAQIPEVTSKTTLTRAHDNLDPPMSLPAARYADSMAIPIPAAAPQCKGTATPKPSERQSLSAVFRTGPTTPCLTNGRR